MNTQKGTYWKFVIWFLGLIVLAIALVFAWNIYSFKTGERSVRDYAEGLEKLGEELYQMQLADTYGGETPQETLQMYIDAVEAGDYELASKYFVIEKQGEELGILRTAPKENIDNVIGLLKQDLEFEGSFSGSGEEFGISRPLTVHLVLYPSGIWKILEI